MYVYVSTGAVPSSASSYYRSNRYMGDEIMLSLASALHMVVRKQRVAGFISFTVFRIPSSSVITAPNTVVL